MKKFNLLVKNILILLVSTQIISCSSSTTIKATPTPTSSLSLFTRIGGNIDAIKIIAEDFMQNVSKNTLLQTPFSEIIKDTEKLKNYNKKLADYICQISNGGCNYSSDNTIQIINLTQEQYNLFKSELTKTLDKFKVLANDKTELNTLFDPLKVGLFIIVAPSPSPVPSVSSSVTPSITPSK